MKRLFHWLQLDAAISWSAFGVAFRTLTGPVSAYLVLLYLGPKEQGYYYTIGSLAALQVIFESGMGQNILQLVAHRYRGSLAMETGLFVIAPEEADRLSAVMRFGVKFYAIVTLLFVLLVGGGGFWFFSATSTVTWQPAWIMLIIGTALSLFLVPFGSLIEGMQSVKELMRARWIGSLTMFAVTSGGLIAGAGVTAGGLGALAGPIVTTIVLWRSWRKVFLSTLRAEPAGELQWRTEVWPFQAKMLLNAFCAFFYWSYAIPVVFKICGPAAAGQFAISWNIVRSASSISTSWTYTRLGKLGQLVAQGDRDGAFHLWRSSFIRGTAIACAGLTVYLLLIGILQIFFPYFGNRFGSMTLQVTLAATTLVQTALLMMAHFMHAHKTDGFVVATIASTLAIIGLQLIFAKTWGAEGAALALFLPSLAVLIAAPWLMKRALTVYWKAESSPEVA